MELTSRLAADFGGFLKEAMLSQSFADVALICCPGGQKFLAHRLVLSAASPYLQEVLLAHAEAAGGGETGETTLILAEVEGAELAALLGLVYTGTARLAAGRLEAFRRAAEALRIQLPLELSRWPRVANRVAASPWAQTQRPHHSPRPPMLRSSCQDGPGPPAPAPPPPAQQPKDANNNGSGSGSGSGSGKGKRCWRCDECGKEFSQLRNYRYHRSQHEGTREFAASCPECGKQLKDRGYLASHMKIHRDRREYACEQCGRGFNQRAAFKAHLRGHAGLKPHRCPLCPDRAFGRKALLRQHLRTHTGERPFRCPHCHKAFADRSNMSLHARLHSGIRPHRCPQPHCPKAFSKKHHLAAHLNCHTGSKPYSCPSCSLAFSQSSNMRTHHKKCALRAHPTPPPPAIHQLQITAAEARSEPRSASP